MIIFWKLLQTFEVPKLVRNEQSSSINNTDFVSVVYRGSIAAKVEAELRKKGFTEAKVSEEKRMIVLRGKVPKGRLAEAVQIAQEAIDGKPLRNEIIEK